ncbi:MAG TPA: MoxR family ATPase [Candidatus Brocadiia bacterium]|nr:MoxR family ATPase [Candidatus Brocadiia bacterium]
MADNTGSVSFRDRFDAIQTEVSKVIVGHDEALRQVLTALMAKGHAILEGVPGLGKTLLIRSLAQALNVRFSRIQFTPDLMPADILGTNIVVDDETKGKRFEFQEGPIFGNAILADEINRATPKTQSALLQAMEERNVTVSRVTHALPPPFFVLATQNPIEMEGTYPLPEAQLDRFMFKINVPASSLSELVEILDRTTGEKQPDVKVVADGQDIIRMQQEVRAAALPDDVRNYCAKLALATHPGSEFATEEVNRFVRFGVSPRGAQALALTAKVMALGAGRSAASIEDVKAVALPSLRHRIILNFEAEADGVSADDIIRKLITD